MATDTLSAYAELGLAPGASEREAKAAWRRLVSQWHPDRNPGPGAVGRMQRLNQALESLRRAGFPQRSGPVDDAPAPPRGRARPAAPAQPPPPPPPPAPAPDPPAPPDAQRTLRRQVRLTLEEAALGCTKVLRGKASHTCVACTGAGWLAQAGDCAGCHGTGQVRPSGWFGLFAPASACTACAGTGQARQACTACSGSGQQVQAGYRISVRLPPGVRDGDTLAVAAHQLPRGSGVAELLIRVRLQPHPLFTLDADGTLHCSLPVSGWAWMANRSVPLPTPDGLQTLQLDRSTTTHRLAGQGFPAGRRGPRADLVVAVQPLFPPVLSTDQQILLDQLVATGMGGAQGAVDDPLAAWQHTLQAWAAGARPVREQAQGSSP